MGCKRGVNGEKGSSTCRAGLAMAGATPGWWHREQQPFRGVPGGHQSSPEPLQVSSGGSCFCPQPQEPVPAAGLEEPLVGLFLREFSPVPSSVPIPVPRKGKALRGALGKIHTAPGGCKKIQTALGGCKKKKNSNCPRKLQKNSNCPTRLQKNSNCPRMLQTIQIAPGGCRKSTLSQDTAKKFQ